MMNDFIAELAEYAMKHGAPKGVLPSLIVAQGILESGSGTSVLATEARNLFGIKKGSGWTGETYAVVTKEYSEGRGWYEIVAEFRKYPSYEGAVIDLVEKYTHGLDWESHNRYAAVIGETDFAKAAEAVFAAGYATDPLYPQKLITIYHRYDLSQFDDLIEDTEPIIEEETVMTKRVAVDAGHGMNTPGKRTPAGEREWTFNNRVVVALIEELGNYEGVAVLRTDDPTGRTDVPLSTRARKANNFNADVFVSVHHNANTGRWGTWTGSETFIMTPVSANPGSLRLAQAVHPRLVGAMKLKDRGIKAANFAVLRETKMPAILTEGGYMDSSIDIVKLRDEATLRAQGVAIAQGIAAFLGLKRKTAESSDPMAKGYLEYGDRGDSVKKLQEDLNTLGYNVEVSGYLNAETKRALMQFQRSQGLSVDGFFGPNSQEALAMAVSAQKNTVETSSPKTLYRVRKSWADVDSQIGAFADLDGAIDVAKAKSGYAVFDEKGKQLYPEVKSVEEEKPVAEIKHTPSASLKAEFEEAVRLGITDGTFPQTNATREQVAVMIVRAIKLIEGKYDGK